jgi:hypothetical protein
MPKHAKVAVIIPALNEAATIVGVVEGVKCQGFDVYVVDDNSNDGTGALASRAGATVLRLPFSSGAWMSLQAGLLYAARSDDYEFFVTLDADGQHDPENIRNLISAYETMDTNVLIASCPQRGSLARRSVWRIFSILTRLRIHDLTSGFRLYDRKALEVLLTHEATLLDYQDLGVLLLLRRYGIECDELPVFMRKRTNGHSRVFRSWVEVGRYMANTFIWIVADWVAGSTRKPVSWEKYDRL